MTMSSYYDPTNRNKDLLVGMDHLQVDLGFSYRNYPDSETPLARMFAPLQTSIWLTIAALVCSAMLVILLTKCLSPSKRRFIIGGRINRTPIINMISLVLGNNIANQRMRHPRYFGTFARTLTLIWMVLFLILRNAYQCSLYHFLHSQKLKSPFDTFDGIRKSDIDIIIDRHGFGFMAQFVENKRYIFFLNFVVEEHRLLSTNGFFLQFSGLFPLKIGHLTRWSE